MDYYLEIITKYEKNIKDTEGIKNLFLNEPMGYKNDKIDASLRGETKELCQKKIISTSVLYKKYLFLECILKFFTKQNFEFLSYLIWLHKDVDLAKLVLKNYGNNMLSAENFLPPSLNIKTCSLEKSILYFLTNNNHDEKRNEILKYYVISGLDVNKFVLDTYMYDSKTLKCFILLGYNSENFKSTIISMKKEIEVYEKKIIEEKKKFFSM